MDVIAKSDPRGGGIAIFAVNRHEAEPTLRLNLAALETQVVEHIELGGVSPLDTNSQAMSERVGPRPSKERPTAQILPAP